MSNIRHLALLERAGCRLAEAERLLETQLGQTPEDVLLSELHEARSALEEITGKRTTEDLLERILQRVLCGEVASSK